MQTLQNIAIPSYAPMVQTQPALDIVNEQLQRGQIAGALDGLFDDLHGRREEEPELWQSYAGDCMNHPIRHLLHQDPFTYRAFSKPRGYAGDAVMMDYIYGLGEAKDAARAATPLGRAIFQYMDTRPSARAVRYRRQLLAGLIDSIADRPDARVMALAAGHLREVELSNAVRTGKLGDFLAIDQDEASLGVVERDYARYGIRPMAGSVRQILAGKIKPGQFDFVYAAGLYDYLNAPIAAALSRRLFAMTRPGGMLLIPNFLAGARDRGYMESFMDWHLIYRDHSEMRELAAALPKHEVNRCQVFDDPDSTITFLLVERRR